MIRRADIVDPRLTLARPGLADQALEGLARAPAFRPTRPMRCVAGSADLVGASGRVETQLLFGERFEVLEVEGGLAFGRASRDGYVGRVEAARLSTEVTAPTHRVSAVRSFAFQAPDYRSRTGLVLHLNALATVEETRGDWLRVAGAGWVASGHLMTLDRFEDDAASVAERFLGTPYRWGGRDSLGLDCSGLVQQALFARGQGCPRDADQQAAEVGVEIGVDDLRRGDLAFWNGHVAMMLGAETTIHANATDMAVATAPLADLVAARGAAMVVRRPD